MVNRLVNYLQDSRKELRHVTWPTREVAIRLAIFVVIFSVIMAAFLGALDLAFTDALKRLVIPQ